MWLIGSKQSTPSRIYSDRGRRLSRRSVRRALSAGPPSLLTVLLLIGSNAFMTTAWYWHLRFRDLPLWQVILVSWASP
jgi:hypothetical protein